MIKSGIKIGDKFNRWTVIGEPIIINTRRKYLCKCDCGTERYVDSSKLKTGKSVSCGCYAREVRSITGKRGLHKTHCMTGTRFYGIWRTMNSRCYYKGSDSYKNYGARGITICDRWHKFENFKEDMYSSYLAHVKEFGEKNTSIDRIDVNGNYEPSNCRWATWSEQQSNRKPYGVKYLVCEEYLTIRQIAEKYGVSYSTIKYRIKNNLDLVRG